MHTQHTLYTVPRSLSWLALLLLGCLLFCGLSTSALAGISPEPSSLVVTTSSDLSNQYDYLTSLREAIAYANSSPGDDTITFGDGSGSGGTNFLDATADTITLAGGQLSLTDTTGETTIQGTGTDRLTIDGNNASRILLVNGDVTAEVSDLTLARGNAVGESGGGAFNFGGTLTVRRAVVRDCVARSGGGIRSQSRSGQPGTLRVIDSTVSGNQATSFGGGIANDWNGAAAVLEIVQSTVVGNSANSSTLAGGGVSATANSTTTVTQTTIAGNTAPNAPGGGISVNNGGYTFTIRNSLVVGNTASDVSATGSGTFTDDGGNLLTVPSGFTLGQVLQVDGTGKPLLANNGGTTPTVALVAGSPAINAGVAVALSTDQRGAGFSRARSGGVDVGAFEVQVLFPQITLAPASQSVAFGGAATFTALANELFAGAAADSLTGGAALLPGQFLLSPNHAYQLIYQTDGNLVLYRGDGAALWNSGTSGQSAGRAEMQTDGNFVIYDAGNVPRFTTLTAANSHAVMRLQDDGNLVIYSAVATPIYATGTSASGPISSPTAQWQVSTNGGGTFTDIAGATAVTLTISNLAVADNQKQYRVLFTNAAGTATSAAATLTVLVETPSLVVTTTSDASTPIDNLTSLREAVAYANSLPGDDTITFAPAMLGQTITLTQANAPIVVQTAVTGGRLTISNPAGPAQLTVSGTNVTRHFTVSPGADVTITGLTLSHGNAGTFHSGGSIFSEGTLGIRQCAFSSNRSALGGFAGALLIQSGTLTLEDSTVADNHGSVLGGGVMVSGGASAVITRCTIRGNTAGEQAISLGFSGGGGIYNGGTLTVTDSTISSNISQDGNGGGGGILNGQTGTQITTLMNVTISGNTARTSDNGTSYSGGGVRMLSGTVTATNCTITGNSVSDGGTGLGPGDGGGVRVNSGTFTASNTLIAGNTIIGSGGLGVDFDGHLTSLGHNLIGDPSGMTGATASDLIGIPHTATPAVPLDAKLGPLQNNGGPTQTHALLPSSPALNAGTAVALTTDQRGQPRSVGPGVDIGAFESSILPIAPTPGRYIGSGADALGAFSYAATGRGSGYITIGGMRYSFLAKFLGTPITVNAKRTGFTPIPVTITARTGDGLHAQLRLSYTDPLTTQLVEVDISRTAYDISNPCPHAGKWKVAFRSSEPVGAPPVSAVGNVIITSTGSVRIVGSTVNRKVFSRGTVMINPATIPFYMNCIRATTQTLQGTLEFAGDRMTGDLRWVVPAGADPAFANAIDEDYEAIGSRFTALPLTAQTGNFTLTNPSITTGPVTGTATLQLNGRLTGVPRLGGVITRGGGLYGAHAESGVITRFTGVYLPVNGQIIGFSRQGNNFGKVSFAFVIP